MKFVNKLELFSELKEVTSTKIIVNGVFNKEGLFSTDIFGSSIAKCLCGKLEGNFHLGQVCKSCNTEAKLYTDEGGKISLDSIENNQIMFFNPIVLKIFQKELKINLMDIVNPQNKKVDLDGNIIIDSSQYSFRDFYENYEETLQRLFEEFNIDSSNEFAVWFLLNPEKLLLTSNVFVLPIRYREIQTGTGTITNNITLDSLNTYYLSILSHVNNIKELVQTVVTSSNIEVELYELQLSYNELSEFIIKEVIGGKEGLVRDNILSNRIGFSGRAPITLRESHEDIDGVTLPIDMFIEIYYLRILHYMISKLNYTIMNADRYIMLNRFNYEDDIILTAIQHIIENEKPVILINRNPTLRIENFLALNVDSVQSYSTIRIAKQCLQAIAGDIDGDTCAIFSVDTLEAKDEVEILKLSNLLLCKYTGGISNYLLPYQDNTIGLELIKDRKNNEQ